MSQFLVEHQGDTHNISRFLKFHPGGSNSLKNFQGKDVGQQLEKIEHSPAAYKLLEDYKVDKNDPTKKLIEDDSLEKLVDWNKAMFWQVGSLGPNYIKWVLSPVDRKLRLFQYDFMELMTITPWFLVPTVWFPVSAALNYLGYQRMLENQYDHLSLLPILLTLNIIGYFVWPLIEYSIHRWIFHLDPPPDSPLLITIHFTLHGLHHKVPFDDQRLLFPPTAAGIVVFFFYKLLGSFLPNWVVPSVLSGGILGYVTYDLIHYYIHYGSPKDGTYLYHMKRYHNHHHFTHHTSGFGISSPIWDYVFGTVIKLKKLGFSLKW